MTPQGIAAIAILLLVSLALIGGQDAEEQERAHSEYCAMVEQKKWPDFKGVYDEHCSRTKTANNH